MTTPAPASPVPHDGHMPFPGYWNWMPMRESSKPISPLPWRFDDTVDTILDANGADLYHVGAGFCDFGVEGRGAADMGYAVHAANTLPKVEAERDRLRAVLRDVEWNGDYHDYSCCPSCFGMEPGTDDDYHKENGRCVGHQPDCALADALKDQQP